MGGQLAAEWGTRETFIAVVTTNLPMVRTSMYELHVRHTLTSYTNVLDLPAPQELARALPPKQLLQQQQQSLQNTRKRFRDDWRRKIRRYGWRVGSESDKYTQCEPCLSEYDI
jgi:hypothetical protein